MLRSGKNEQRVDSRKKSDPKAKSVPKKNPKKANPKKANPKKANPKKANPKKANPKKAKKANPNPKKAVPKSAAAERVKALEKRVVGERPDLRWLSIAAEEGSEPQVAKVLGRLRGIAQILLPMHDGVALYSGYVFAECCRNDDILDEICQIPGVEGVLARNGVFNYALGGHEPPAELEASALSSIRNSYARYTRRARGEMVAVARGQRITIIRGVFSGMSGEVVSVNRREMSIIAKVCLSDGGMIRKVSVKHGQFELLEGQEEDDWRI